MARIDGVVTCRGLRVGMNLIHLEDLEGDSNDFAIEAGPRRAAFNILRSGLTDDVYRKDSNRVTMSIERLVCEGLMRFTNLTPCSMPVVTKLSLQEIYPRRRDFFL